MEKICSCGFIRDLLMDQDSLDNHHVCYNKEHWRPRCPLRVTLSYYRLGPPNFDPPNVQIGEVTWRF
ncbi:MAG: hypothetical protein DWI24_05660 [Planctomycetota bacterium]|nr:MAG: hypothetical protein DWI24_05660 [Planctomycetota bacterium]